MIYVALPVSIASEGLGVMLQHAILPENNSDSKRLVLVSPRIGKRGTPDGE
jgi:hypothetical protein